MTPCFVESIKISVILYFDIFLSKTNYSHKYVEITQPHFLGYNSGHLSWTKITYFL